jgi:hypothetical protein
MDPTGIRCNQRDWWFLGGIGLLGAAFLIIGQAFTTRHRPPRRAPRETDPSNRKAGQRDFIWDFIWCDLIWSLFSAVLVTLVFSSHVATDWIARAGNTPLDDYFAGGNVPLMHWPVNWKLVAIALAGAPIFAAGWIVGWLIQGSWRDVGSGWGDFRSWSLSGIVYGGLIGLGAVFFSWLDPYNPPTPDAANLKTLLPMILGIPWALTSQLAAEAVFVGLTCYGNDSDSDREWLGRAGGFTAAAAFAWALTSLLSVGVGHYIIYPDSLHLRGLTASLGAISGVATALLGKSSLTEATTDDSRPGITGLALNLVLKVAGPKPQPKGLTLGTAMAISGAAVSPNMGYSSSPSIALLLTLFNVRLGWWLGNPGTAGEKSYRTEGPSFAVKPLVKEALGLTTDDQPYVYLSDGGHFEDLGLYEMVRRRCRFMVVVDAGEDRKFAFEDLGSAVRKIYIDLGVNIEFLQIIRGECALDLRGYNPSTMRISRSAPPASAASAS